MPQPLKQTPLLIVGPEAISERQELAILIGRISTGWAMVEAALGDLLAEFSHADPPTAIAIYLGLTGQTSKNAALEAAANHILSEEDAKTFKDLATEVSRTGRQRNKVVHAIWAYSPDLPDTLIHIDPADWIREHSYGVSHPGPHEQSAVVVFGAGFEAPRMAWRRSDFEQIERRIAILTKSIFDFRYGVARRYRKPRM